MHRLLVLVCMSAMIRGCLSFFYGLRFYARLDGYYECVRVEHAHQIVSVVS